MSLSIVSLHLPMHLTASCVRDVYVMSGTLQAVEFLRWVHVARRSLHDFLSRENTCCGGAQSLHGWAVDHWIHPRHCQPCTMVSLWWVPPLFFLLHVCLEAWHTYTAYLSLPWPSPILFLYVFSFLLCYIFIFCFVHATGGL